MLSERVRAQVKAEFGLDDQAEALLLLQRLEAAGADLAIGADDAVERAAVTLAAGDLKMLRGNVEVGVLDGRDLLANLERRLAEDPSIAG